MKIISRFLEDEYLHYKRKELEKHFRIQNMRVVDGKPEYRNAFDVWARVVKNEGFFALWKGFTPYYFRLGPHTVLTFIFLEQMNAFYFRKILGLENFRGAL